MKSENLGGNSIDRAPTDHSDDRFFLHARNAAWHCIITARLETQRLQAAKSRGTRRSRLVRPDGEVSWEGQDSRTHLHAQHRHGYHEVDGRRNIHSRGEMRGSKPPRRRRPDEGATACAHWARDCTAVGAIVIGVEPRPRPPAAELVATRHLRTRRPSQRATMRGGEGRPGEHGSGGSPIRASLQARQTRRGRNCAEWRRRRRQRPTKDARRRTTSDGRHPVSPTSHADDEFASTGW